MSREKNLPIHGSVIQRSLIPEGLGAVLNIATVPLLELDKSCLGDGADEGFRRLVGQVIGVPAESLIDERRYQELAVMLRKGRLWEEMAMRAHSPYAEELYHLWRRYWRDLFMETKRDTRMVAFPDRSTELLGLHSLSLMVSPTRSSGFGWPLPIPPFPF